MVQKKIIYIFPTESVDNAYHNKNIFAWRNMGFYVKDFSVKLYMDLKIARKHKTLILNWYEDYMLYNDRPQWVSLSWAVLLLLFGRIFVKKIIWVRHNHKPHHIEKPTWAYKALISILPLVSRFVVTHSDVTEFDSQVAPHPLNTIDSTKIKINRDIEFLWFGSIAKYKALDLLLLAWPKDKKLVIAGKSNDNELTARLLEIIHSNNLEVEWENKFISNAELDDIICRSKYVVLAHEDKSMIVSGAFYHAISCGANILIRNGEFSNKMSNKHKFVTTFQLYQLHDIISHLIYIHPNEVVYEANENYGDSKVYAFWDKILNN